MLRVLTKLRPIRPRGLSQRVLLLIGLVTTMSIAGCDTELPDTEQFDLGISVQENSVMLITCEDISVQSVRLSWRSRDDGSEANAWDADGTLDLRKGQELNSSSAPEGLTVRSWGSFDLAAADRVGFYAFRGSGYGIGVNIVVPSGGVPDGKWLHSDGTVGDEPCE